MPKIAMSMSRPPELPKDNRDLKQNPGGLTITGAILRHRKMISRFDINHKWHLSDLVAQDFAGLNSQSYFV